MTLDTWGPQRVGADRIWLVTVQDRGTRLSSAVPAAGAVFSDNGISSPRASRRIWARAVLVANLLLMPGGIQAGYSDNGVGMASALGVLPLAVRLALCLGARAVFMPPAQPWRTGKREHFHHSMELECWRREGPTTMPSADQGLREWLTFHLLDEQHQLANQQSRTRMRRSRRDETLAGGSTVHGSAPDGSARRY